MNRPMRPTTGGTRKPATRAATPAGDSTTQAEDSAMSAGDPATPAAGSAMSAGGSAMSAGDSAAAGGFASYYGRPVLKPPVWTWQIAAYLFLGGLAGTSSALAAGAQLTGRDELARTAKLGAGGAIGLAMAVLIHDLGRSARFLNMLRVFKPSSPMSMGSWLLAGYGPMAGVAALQALAGRRLPRVGAAATAGAAVLGPAVATYTAPLICDTAVPAWHEGYREMPFLFTGSAATAAGGLGMLGAPPAQSAPARRLAVAGVVTELVAAAALRGRLGPLAEPYGSGRAGRLMRAGEILGAAGAAGALLARRRRAPTALCGLACLAASAATRLGVFEAGLASARDPRYTIQPQRARLDRSRPVTK